MGQLLGFLIFCFVTYIFFAFILGFGRMAFVIRTMHRLQGAFQSGKITKIQYEVMMRDMVNPRDTKSIKEVADWLDDQGIQ